MPLLPFNILSYYLTVFVLFTFFLVIILFTFYGILSLLSSQNSFSSLANFFEVLSIISHNNYSTMATIPVFATGGNMVLTSEVPWWVPQRFLWCPLLYSNKFPQQEAQGW